MKYESSYYGIAGLGDDSLYHHGIKGQKWYRRRFQNPDGSLTEAGRKRYLVNEKAYRDFASRMSIGNADQDTVIKRGSKFDRIGNGNEQDDDRRTYVSRSEHDRQLYTLAAGAEFGIEGTHKLKLTAVDDIKVAGYKARLSAMVDTVKDVPVDDILSSMHIPSIVRGKETRNSKQERKALKKLIAESQTDYERFQEFYKKFSQHIMRDTDLTNKYYKNLQSKGYDAIMDDNDNRSGWADSAMVILNRKKSLKTISVSEITSRDRDQADEYIRTKLGW